MKYIKPFKVVKSGNTLVVHLTEAIKTAGMERGTPVKVSVTEDNKIVIEERGE